MTTIRVQPTTLTTAADALRGEEIDRTRAFVRIGWLIAVFVAGATLVLPGDERIRTALLGTIGVAVLGSLWVYRQLGDRAHYNVRIMHVLAFAAIVCGQLGILYVGIFSAAPLIVGLGLYFFCRTESFATALGVYLLAALSHGAEAVLVTAGFIDDPGFAPARSSLPIISLIAGHLTVQQAYAMSFFLARLSRRSSLRAIEQLQRATRVAAQRDVQLAELRQDLDRALKVGGPGRFTGHHVGSWTLGSVLGRGAMGEVYEATSTGQGGVRDSGARNLPPEAAVKMLRRELLSDPSHVERFFREMRVASSLDSPHVVKVLQASTLEDPIPFLAMERLRGQTLGDLVRQGPVTGPRLRSLVEQVGGVIDRAREAGIVHRDLKPHNLFLTEEGNWKVLDFGVALLGDSSGTLTQGAVVGTPTYMAPEQARGEPVDHRADVYALGAVIYRCLTGRVPFVARDTPSLLYAVVHSMPLQPSSVAPVSAAEEICLAIAMAKDKRERFATTAELAAAFAQAWHGVVEEDLVRRSRILLRQRPWAVAVDEQ
ncbi:MAG TPA: serine/threonine-protein kinase [Kofleriaceae bacterium]|nr:serine/threonine-protein kinase [Kofleriaceae bacterium]